MGLGGLTLAAVFFLVGGIFVPRLVNRRQALILSREGDRFSSGLRLLNEPAEGARLVGDASRNTPVPVSPDSSIQHRNPMPLLRDGTKPAQIETTMTTPPVLHAPNRPRSATTLRMTAEQTRRLAALKAERAARLSTMRAAAHRRLVTVGATAALTALFAVLAALSVFTWWWVILPATLLVGSIAGSRVAAINIEKAREREEEQFRALQEQVDARGGTRTAVVNAPAFAEPVLETPDESTASKATATEAVTSESTSITAEEDVPGAVIAAKQTDGSVELSGVDPDLGAEEDAAVMAASRSWSIREHPVPASVRKAKVQRRSIHIDTDLKGIPEVSNRLGRPLEPSDSVAGKPVTVEEEYNLDLDAVLEARRAQ